MGSFKMNFMILGAIFLFSSLTNGTSVPGGKEMQSVYARMSCPELDVDLYGNDIDAAHGVSDWHHCGGICELMDGCKFWSYSPGQQKCWMKVDDDGIHHDSNYISG